MRILTLLLVLVFAITSCEQTEILELELDTQTVENRKRIRIPVLLNEYVPTYTNTNQVVKRLVDCQNAGNGYTVGQPASGAIATIQVDSVYCDSTSTARVAAQFYPPNNTLASWYDVEWQYLSDTTSGQFLDYVLPVDSLGLSVYYTLTVIAQPNATHANPNSTTIVATDSYF